MPDPMAPQGALSQVSPSMAPPPPAGPAASAGALPSGPGPGGPPMPGAPPVAPAGPPARQPKPGNEGLINRVLGLISGETKAAEMEAHQKALAEAMKTGAQQAVQGIVSHASQALGGGLPGGGAPSGLPGQGDPAAQIRGLMGQAGGQGFARGGYPDLIGLDEPPGLPVRGHFASGGPSRFVPPNGMNGRSDKVEARLSPNEYVMDAETVSMLGDGSPDAGADQLDRFRANVRKHKGKALAKGKFSPNARKPESYL